ncbi:MAG: RHS repeat domain-containing protein, partial [Pseudomonadota bacterium]
MTYTWDSTTGGNAGKGRLTGVTDQSGTHSRFYDPRGNLLQDNRVIAGRSYATTYTYDSADRIASITYPSGRIITYTRDTSGRITGITTRETSVAPVFTVASGIAWQPMAGMAGDSPASAGTATQLQALPGLDGFGSVDLLQALTYGNGLQQWKTFTTDNEVDLIQLYNGPTVVTQRDIDRQDGMNVTGIADAITPANNQNFGYSDAARLTTASGPYGPRSWSYDGVGNRTGETISGVSTVWSYVNGTNRLSTVVQGATTQRAFTYDTAGNITQDLR